MAWNAKASENSVYRFVGSDSDKEISGLKKLSGMGICVAERTEQLLQLSLISVRVSHPYIVAVNGARTDLDICLVREGLQLVVPQGFRDLLSHCRAHPHRC